MSQIASHNSANVSSYLDSSDYNRLVSRKLDMGNKDIDKIVDRLRKESENRIPNIIKWLEEMGQFTEDNIPEPPILEKDLYDKYVIPNFIRCGAIPKDGLIIGKTYIGNCRNASEAVWNGDFFTYKRTKFGNTYDENINHFQDDDGHDVFVPIKVKE